MRIGAVTLSASPPALFPRNLKAATDEKSAASWFG